MRFVVFDDHSDEFERLCRYLRGAFPAAAIWPEPATLRVFSTWEEVLSAMGGLPDDADTVAFVDRSIGGDSYGYAQLGDENVWKIRSARPSWTVILYTRYGCGSEVLAAVDGVLEKQDLDVRREDAGRAQVVSACVRRARAKRNPGVSTHSSPVTTEDSPGTRSFLAGLGQESLDTILENEAVGWSDVRVEALTGGMSGAFVMLLSGRTGDGAHRLVVKAAREEQLLTSELENQRAFQTQSGVLSLHLLFFSGPLKRLALPGAAYMTIPLLPGETLLDACRRGVGQAALARVLDAEVAHYRACMSDGLTSVKPAGGALRLTPADCDRLSSSAPFLRQLGEELTERVGWPAGAPSAAECAEQAMAASREWRTSSVLAREVTMLVQHGDLNPRNVIVGPDGGFMFIDPARLGRWPLGYDISRLSVLLRLRLMDSASCRDYFPQRVADWVAEPIGEAAAAPGTPSLCEESATCEQAFRRLLDECGPIREQLELGYRLGRTWDLLKIMSYSDVSPFKRLWAMVESTRTWQTIVAA